MGWGLHTHFHVQPNYSVEVMLWLCCVVVGVVTIYCSCCFCFVVVNDVVFVVVLSQKPSIKSLVKYGSVIDEKLLLLSLLLLLLIPQTYL